MARPIDEELDGIDVSRLDDPEYIKTLDGSSEEEETPEELPEEDTPEEEEDENPDESDEGDEEEDPEEPEGGEGKKKDPPKVVPIEVLNEERNKAKRLELELQQLRQGNQAPKKPDTKPEEELDPEIEEALTSLDPVLKAWAKKNGYVPKTVIDEENMTRAEQQAYDARNEQLIQKYDGSDGRPKFDPKELEIYADENEIFTTNLEKVYKDKYEKELDEWKERQIEKKVQDSLAKRGTPIKTDKPTSKGSKKVYTEEEIDSMSGEELEKLVLAGVIKG